jgi:E3 ubiquitin-protein ligase DOA10
MSEEKFCRVCRCEGTPDQPLFHPCKCRGSIKYIHQDCLTYWLDHSNKDTCDICHSKFNFKIIYNENVPKNLPIKIILKQFFKYFIQFQYIIVKYFLMFFSAFIEVPFVVTMLDRIVDWQLGVPIGDNGVSNTLIYGNDYNPNGSIYDFTSFIQNTLLRGILTVALYTIIIASMIMIQNSFVGDEGFQKIINKKIGMDPKKHKLLEMLQRVEQQQRRDEALQRFRERQREINQVILIEQREREQREREQREREHREREHREREHREREHREREHRERERQQRRRMHMTKRQKQREQMEIDQHISLEIEAKLKQSYEDSGLTLNEPITTDVLHKLKSYCISQLEKHKEMLSFDYDKYMLEGVFYDFDPEIDINNIEKIQDMLLNDKKIRLNDIQHELGDCFFSCVTLNSTVDSTVHPLAYPNHMKVNNLTELYVGYPAWNYFADDIARKFHASRRNGDTTDAWTFYRNAIATKSELEFEPESELDSESESESDMESELDSEHDFEPHVEPELDLEFDNNLEPDLEPVQLDGHGIFPEPQQQRIPRFEVPLNDPRIPPRVHNVDVPAGDPLNDANVPAVEGMWDGPKNITFVIQLTLLANLVSLIVLICFKLIPSYTGFFFLSIIHALSTPLNTLLVLNHQYIYPYIQIIEASNIYNGLLGWYNDSIAPKLMVAFFERNLYDPLINAYFNTVEYKPTSDKFERLFVMLAGYSFFGFVIYLSMKKMERSCTQNNPLAGTYRLIYIIFLQITSVIKVFILIAIEWALFPLFCGSQVEFALVPVFNNDLYNYKLDIPLAGLIIPKIVQLWFTGTFFMYFFASFVSMIRSKTLRNGVLFFIRPSDDPNLQLVHDALMRPFGLRLSRIALSAAVYSVYIHLEFTFVSWGFRLFSPLPVLPFFSRFFVERIAFCLIFIATGFMHKLFFAYWNNTFKYACSKLRLSSFLLNQDIPEERGRIIYRNFFARFSKVQPDFSNPVLESETSVYFAKHQNELCCFVPDGNYVRAPDDDHVARKFVKTLFVPVTKTDQLLAPIPEYPDDEEKYNPYGDIDPMDVTTYTIVYRPPNFRFRLFQFFSYLWAASMLMTLGFYLINIIIGKFLFYITGIGNWLGLPAELYVVDCYSVLLTTAILSQIINGWEILQKHNAENAQNTPNGVDKFTFVLRALSRNLKNALNAIKNNIFVKAFASLVYFFILSTLILRSLAPITLLLQNQENQLVLHFIIMISLTPVLYMQSSRDWPFVNIYRGATIMDITLRLSTLIWLNYSGNLPTFSSSEFANGFTLSKYIPEDYQKWLFVFYLTDSYNYILEYLHLSIWSISLLYVANAQLSSLWTQFQEKTKELYYSNMKILSNADENVDDKINSNTDNNDTNNDA